MPNIIAERGRKSIDEKPKRKTTTSSAVKNRYNAKTYSQIAISVKKDTAAAYKAKCTAEGIPFSAPLHKAIEDFLAH